MKSIAITGALLGLTSAYRSVGVCPEVNQMASLDTQQIAGMWYEGSRDRDSWAQWGLHTCSFLGLDVRFDDSVTATYAYKSLYIGWLFPLLADYYKFYCPNDDGNCISGPSDSTLDLTADPDHIILASDYTSYMITYRCTPSFFETGKVQEVTVWTRSPGIGANKKVLLNEIIKNTVPTYDVLYQEPVAQGPDWDCDYGESYGGLLSNPFDMFLSGATTTSASIYV